MEIKPIKSAEFEKLLKLTNEKMDRRLEWLNHTGYAYAHEIAGRLYYDFIIKISKNIGEKVTTATQIDENYNKVLKIERIK